MNVKLKSDSVTFSDPVALKVNDLMPKVRVDIIQSVNQRLQVYRVFFPYKSSF